MSSAPSPNASFAVPMFDEYLMTSDTEMIFSGWSSLIVVRPMRNRPFSQLIGVADETNCSSTAAAATNGLKTEPGSKASVTARFFIARVSSFRVLLGLWVGRCAKAMMAPVSGSMTTAVADSGSLRSMAVSSAFSAIC